MSKDSPQSQDEFNERYMDNRPDDQEFKEAERCPDCGTILECHPGYETPFGFETGWYWCEGCKSQIVPEDPPTYQCSLCLKENETEECNCYARTIRRTCNGINA